MSRPVLVTGAYGFIGRHVALALASEGHTVTGLGHGTWTRDEWRKWGIHEWHALDITLENLVTYAGKPVIVIHCAGSGSIAFSATHPHQDFQRTVSTTAAVLEFVRLHAIDASVVYPSSAAVYGSAKRLPIAETDTLDPVSPYGIHKLMAEQLCSTYASHFGVRTAVVRLFSVYGIGLRKQLLWDACTKLRRGDAVFFGTGTEVRDWLHADDAARLLVMAGRQASNACVTVNGGTGTGTSVADVIAEIRNALNTQPKPLFDGRLTGVDPPAYVADIARAASWGWRSQKSLREGIRQYVEWFAAGAN